MLASGAHVKIGSYEYVLDQTQQYHYVRSSEKLEVPGYKRSLRDRLLWTFDDWAGGEGNRRYYSDEPEKYLSSDGANVRIRGQITGRPIKSTATPTAADYSQPLLMDVGGGYVWACGDDKTYYSSDGTSFSAGPTVTGNVTAVCGSDDSFWVASHDGSKRYLYKVTTGAATEVMTGGVTGLAFKSIAFRRGRIYGWTGGKLWEHDVFENLPLTSSSPEQYRRVYPTANTTIENPTYTGMESGYNSLLFFTSTLGRTAVYEFRNRVARPIWHLPPGFTGQAMAFSNGVVFVGGHYGTGSDGTGKGCLYGMNLANRQPEFLTWIRKDSADMHIKALASSYEDQVLVATDSDRIFVWDHALRALSCLDAPSVATGVASDAITFGPRRLIAYAGSAYTILSYKDDEPGNVELNTAMAAVTTGEWDMDVPFETKILHGFHVNLKPLTSGQSVLVEYQIDNSGSWVSAGTVTSASTGNSTGRVYLALTPVTFFTLAWRVSAPAGGGGVAPPIVKAVTAEGELLAYQQYWDLIVRVKDEVDKLVAGRKWRAETARDYLESLVTSKAAVTFLDGYRKSGVGQYTTHTVTVENPQDVIERNAEGIMRIRLKAVPS